MIPATFAVRDRGATPRGMRKAFNAASKAAWFTAAVEQHATNTDKRFTHRHATLAGYGKRVYRYEIQKLRKHGHTNPLEFSGESRRAVRTARITSTSNGARLAFSGARKFNFRNPKSNINMAEEFTRIPQVEADEIAKNYDAELDKHLNSYNSEN